MKKTVRIFSFLLLAILVLLPTQSAAAKRVSFEGKVIFGQSFTLKTGEILDGDLLVFGGTATLEEGSRVNGSVVLFGGSLVVDGEVSGDVAVTGGTVTIGASAHLYGNLTTVATSLERAEGSQIDGEINNTATSWVANGENGNNPIIIPPVPSTPVVPIRFDPISPVINSFGQALSLAVLAMLVMLFLAPQADRVVHSVMVQPFTTGGLGLLTLIVSPIALVLLSITIILIPVVIVIVIALVVAAVFGWIAIGYEIGQRFTNAIHKTWHPAFSAGLGVFALTLASEALTGIPVLNCVGWLVPFLLGLAGLGAVIMTRFGTQSLLAPSAVPASPLATPASAIPAVVEPESPAQEPAAPKRKPRSK